ncbi:MAG: sulfatase-like hydrolase/transferase, partial [Mameliella sp.]|nr:sulfatase-like hydrolase/transferase [Phaeodactylibacter sp.]
PEKRFAYDPAWFDKPKGTSTDWGAFPVHDSLTFDKRIADWAIDQLQQFHDGPVFLAAGFMRPHVPWYVSQQWLERFDSLEIDVPEYLADDWSDIPGMAEKITDLEMMPEMEWMQEGGRWESAVKSYLASVHFVDHQIGRVLKALEESEMAKNTIIVLASDHGYHLGEKGLFQKSTLWYRSTHIPMVWAGRGIKKGTSDEPVSLIDIYPTLTSLISEHPGHELEGKSLMPLLKKEQVSVDNYALTTYGPNNHSVIADSWHYIRYNDGSEELYNLTEDQAEHHNLAGEPSVQAIKQGLREHLPSLNLDNNRYSALHNTPYFEAYNQDEK